MKVLIIYEEVPESIKYYVIEADEKDIELLEAINNQYINSVGWEDFEVPLSQAQCAMISDTDKEFLDDFIKSVPDYEKWANKWFKGNTNTPIKETIERVYNFGFYL